MNKDIEENLAEELVEDVEFKEVVVETKDINVKPSKPRGGNYFMKVIKSFMGLYIIGAIVNLNDMLMTSLEPLLTSLHSSAFMSANLVPWAGILMGPVRFIVGLLAWFTPIVLITTALIMLMSKIKWISKKEVKVFTYVAAIIFLLIF